MTNYVESDGWFTITSGSDTIKLYFEHAKYKPFYKARNKHYDTGINIYIPVPKKYIILTIEDIWVEGNAKIVNYVKYLTSWLDSGAPSITLAYNSDGDLEKMDGVNTVFPMAPKADLGNIEKISYGDQEVYYIDKLYLEQVGTAS